MLNLSERGLCCAGVSGSVLVGGCARQVVDLLGGVDEERGIELLRRRTSVVAIGSHSVIAKDKKKGILIC